MKIIETLDEAKLALASEETALVCFMQRWCPPCRMINLSFEKFAKEHPNANIFKIDVNQFKELAVELNATAIPVTLLIKNGHIVKALSGFLDPEEVAKLYYDEE